MIDVLLSVYGKADFLGEFLQSLKAQDRQDFRLLYRFDGPAFPEAERLLAAFSMGIEVPGRIHRGVVGSYQELLQASSADHLMLADQDDVWHPDKVSCSAAAIRQAEMEIGKEVPILVHSDLRTVDRCGRLICPSFWKFQALSPQRKNLRDLMIQNNVTGCAVILNRALAVRTACFPAGAICHDWFLALTAAAFGRIEFIDRPLIDYRQHEKNVIGAVSRRKMLLMAGSRQRLHERIVLAQQQAADFLEQFREELAPEQIRILEVWGKEMPNRGYFQRLKLCLQYGFRKNDWLRTLGLWWAL